MGSGGLTPTTHPTRRSNPTKNGFLPEICPNTGKSFKMSHLSVLDLSSKNLKNRRRRIRGGGTELKNVHGLFKRKTKHKIEKINLGMSWVIPPALPRGSTNNRVPHPFLVCDAPLVNISERSVKSFSSHRLKNDLARKEKKKELNNFDKHIKVFL